MIGFQALSWDKLVPLLQSGYVHCWPNDESLGKLWLFSKHYPGTYVSAFDIKCTTALDLSLGK